MWGYIITLNPKQYNCNKEPLEIILGTLCFSGSPGSAWTVLDVHEKMLVLDIGALIPRPSMYPLLDSKYLQFGDHIPLFEGTRRVLVITNTISGGSLL